MSLVPEFQGISAEHPWPGLMPFTEDAQAFFHGRDAETAELLRLIKREPLTVLFGQSGLGKSSLLNAGLFPRLRREDFLPIYLRLDISPDAPDLAAQTRAIVARNLEQHAVDTRTPRPDETLWEYFHATDVDFWSTRNQLLTPVLVFDQFEELFTLGRASDEMRRRCRAFIEELGDLIENRTPETVVRKLEEDADLAARLDFAKRNCKILLSFREDFLPDFEGLRRTIRSIMQNRMRLTRMRATAALEAITLSGRNLVAPGIAERIVEFVSGPRGGGVETDTEYAHLEIEPALLSLVCRELNNKRIAARRAQITADLLESGAQQEIIADFYERSLADLDPGTRVFVEDQLLTESGYRDSYALEDALTLPGVTREAMDSLVARRLLRLDERFGVLRIELTHDVLTRVVRDSRDRRQQRLAVERRQAQDAARRRRMRVLIAWSATGVGIAVSVAVTFAILFNRALEEKQRLIETQSLALLEAANRQLELNIAGEPQAILAKSLVLNPANQGSVARAVSYLTQRTFPKSVAQMEAGLRDNDPYFSIDWIGPASIALRGRSTSTAIALQLRPGGEIELSRVPAGIGTAERAALAQRERRRLWRTALAGEPSETASPMTRSADGGVVAWIEGKARLRVAWGIGRREETLDLPEGAAPPVQFSADGRRILVGSARAMHVVTLSTPSGLQLSRTLPTEDGRLRFGTGGRQIAALNRSNVTIYDFDADRTVELVHPLSVNSLEVSPDGARLVTACQDKFARIWDTAAGTLAAAPLRHDGAVLSASFSEDGRRVITGSLDGTARIWSTGSGELVSEPLVTGSPVAGARISSDGRRVLTYSMDRRLTVWDIDSSMSTSPSIRLPARITVVEALSERSLVALATQTGDVSLWQVGVPPGVDGRPAQLWSARLPHAVTQLRFSPDGTLLAIATAGRDAYLWDVKTGKPVGEPLRHRGAILTIRFSRDSASLATGAADGGARVWRVATRRLRGGVRVHEREAVTHVAFSPDGRLLLTGASGTGGGALRIWNLDEDVLEEKVAAGRRIALADFIANREIVAAFDTLVAAWSIEARGEPSSGEQSGFALKERKRIDLGSVIWSAGVSPDGSRLVAGGLDGTSKLIDLTTMRPFGEAMRSIGVVLAADFTPDGRWVVTRSADRAARVWDGRHGQAVTDSLPHDADPALPHFRLALAGGSRYLLSSSGDGTVTVRTIALDFPPPAPAWLPALLQAAGGGELDDAGTMNWIVNRRDRLRAIGAQIGHDPSSWWTHWASGTIARLIPVEASTTGARNN